MAKSKKTLEEVFLHRLETMCSKTPNGRVSGSALENALNWSVEGRYATVRRNLIAQGKVRAHQGGPGGSLECCTAVKPAGPTALKAFISYSHADAGLKTELLKHLSPLTRSGLINHWHDGDISVGKEWEREIWSNFRSADIIVLLITIDFINSEYCYDRELAAAVERHKSKRACIIPIIGRNCLWQDLPFGSIQATLQGKAVAAFADRDEALTQVAREIKKAADDLVKARVVAS